MLEGTQSGCAVHTATPAKGHCKQCGKPYCNICEVKAPFGRFCCEACRDQYHNFVEKAEALEANRKKTRNWRIGPWIRRLVILLILLIFIGLVASLIEIPYVSDIVAIIRAKIGI